MLYESLLPPLTTEEELEITERRLRHLLQSDFIASFDSKKPGSNEYVRDIEEADWIAFQAAKSKIKENCMAHNGFDFTFAKRLEQVMIERNLYPKDLERITGIRKRRIYEYIQGQHQPNAFAIMRIAKGLGISADWLLGIEK